MSSFSTILSLQNEAKQQSITRDAVGALQRDLSTKLISLETPLLQSLDSELLLNQSLWFILSTQQSSNHELPAPTYTDLSKPAFEFAKPFAFNTELDYINLLSQIRADPYNFAQILHKWDLLTTPGSGSANTSSVPLLPQGVSIELYKNTLSYTILRDIYGYSDDALSTDLESITPLTKSHQLFPLQSMSLFLLHYINIIFSSFTIHHQSNQNAFTDKNISFVAYLLKPTGFFSKLLHQFIQLSCKVPFTHVMLPILSWFVSNEHLDISGDWLALVAGFTQLSNSSTSTGDKMTQNTANIPLPQASFDSPLSQQYLNVFSTFCFLGNLTLSQSGSLPQLVVNVITTLSQMFKSLPQPVLVVLAKIIELDQKFTKKLPETTQHDIIQINEPKQSKSVEKDYNNDTNDREEKNSSKKGKNNKKTKSLVESSSILSLKNPLDEPICEQWISNTPFGNVLQPLQQLTAQTKQLQLQQAHQQQTDRQRLQTLFTPQLWQHFLPILSVSEFSSTLPSILQPNFLTSDEDENDLKNAKIKPTGNEFLSFDVLTHLFDSISAPYASTNSLKPTTFTPILSLLFQVIIQPLVHTPEIYNIVTSTPVTAISRRNLLIMTMYIQFLFKSFDLLGDLSFSPSQYQLTAPKTSPNPSITGSATESTPENTTNQVEGCDNSSAMTFFQKNTSTNPFFSAIFTFINQSLEGYISSSLKALSTGGGQGNNNGNISFMRSPHISGVAISHFLLVLDQIYAPISSISSQIMQYIGHCDDLSSNWAQDDKTAKQNTHNHLDHTPAEIAITAIPLNILYGLHGMLLSHYQRNIPSKNHQDNIFSVVQNLSTSLPILQPLSSNGNRYLLLKLATPRIENIISHADTMLDNQINTFWTETQLLSLLSDFISLQKTVVTDGSFDTIKAVDYKPCIPSIKQIIMSTIHLLSSLPPLDFFFQSNNSFQLQTYLSPTSTMNPISILLYIFQHFGQLQYTPNAMTILEAMTPLFHSLPPLFHYNNFALLSFILEQYQHTVCVHDDESFKKASILLTTCINHYVPALFSRLRTRSQTVAQSFFKFQIRKHLATHYSSIISFHTFLTKEVAQNLNLFNGYPRVFHRYLCSLLPPSYELIFKTIINPEATQPAPQPFHRPLLQQAPLLLPLNFPANPPISLSDSSLLPIHQHYDAIIKQLVTSSSTNLSKLAIMDLQKTSFSSFLTLPLNGITSMLHPSCGGRYPVDLANSVYICADCVTKMTHKQKILKSFIAKYFADKLLTLPQVAASTTANPKRIIELYEIAGYGGGFGIQGINGILPSFSIDTTSTSSNSNSTISSSFSSSNFAITPQQSYVHVLDYILSHTTLKLFAICPTSDNRWGLDISFLLSIFPTFSSWYSYISQPTSDSLDQVLVLPLLINYITAILDAYAQEYIYTPQPPMQTPPGSRFNSRGTTSPLFQSQNISEDSSAPQTPVKHISMEEDPLAALAQQAQTSSTPSTPKISSSLNVTDATLDVTTPLSSPLGTPALGSPHNQPVTQPIDHTLQLNTWITHITAKLRELLPNANNPDSTTTLRPLVIAQNVPYIGRTTITEAIVQLERALTVSSLSSKLAAMESLRGILSTALSNSSISKLPYDIPTAIDGQYYAEYHCAKNTILSQSQGSEETAQSNQATDAFSMNKDQYIPFYNVSPWASLESSFQPTSLPVHSHSLFQRSFSNSSISTQPPLSFNFSTVSTSLISPYPLTPLGSSISQSNTSTTSPSTQIPYQFANLYDFGYINHERSPHIHSITSYQPSQNFSIFPTTPQLNHSRFFDKHTKLPHIFPRYPSLKQYSYSFPHYQSHPLLTPLPTSHTYQTGMNLSSSTTLLSPSLMSSTTTLNQSTLPTTLEHDILSTYTSPFTTMLPSTHLLSLLESQFNNVLPFFPFVESSTKQQYNSSLLSPLSFSNQQQILPCTPAIYQYRSKPVTNSADDFIFIFCYLLLISQPRHLPSTLTYIKLMYFNLYPSAVTTSTAPSPLEQQYKSYLDICIVFRAIQNVSDRMRHNLKTLFNDIVPADLQTYAKAHFTPKAPTLPSIIPANRPPNRIEQTKSNIVTQMVLEGYYCAEDVTAVVDTLQTQTLFDTDFKNIISHKLRAQKPTY